MRTRCWAGPVAGITCALAAGIVAAAEAEAPAGPMPSPGELWERLERTLPPFTFSVLRDSTAPSDMLPRVSLRRIDVRFTSQVIRGARMDHTAAIFLPADPAAWRGEGRRGKAVVVGQRLWDDSMVANYGDAIAAHTGYPTMVVPNPGEFDGADGEGRWIYFLRSLVAETKDPVDHNYFRLAVPYLRALDVLGEVLGEKEIRAVIGGHSKRATSAITAAAIDPRRVVGLVYMGNETVFSRTGAPHLRAISPAFTQKHVACPVLYLGATNEDGYEMFNINRIQALLDRPWTIEVIPNYRHATASEVQMVDWRMWVAHVFDGRPVAAVSELLCRPAPGGTYFRARVEAPGKVLQVKFWYVYCDDVPYWRDLVWYPLYPEKRERGFHEAFLDGKVPDAWLVEVKDAAGGFPGYVSSLPRDITGKPTKERVSRGWRSRHWEPAAAER